MDYEKEAGELFDKFLHEFVKANADYVSEPAKQCALIVVEKIIKNNRVLLESGLNNDFSIMDNNADWLKLKEAIEKL